MPIVVDGYKGEEIDIHAPGTWDNEVSIQLDGWWAVSNPEGIVAYFSTEEGACAYKDLITGAYVAISSF